MERLTHQRARIVRIVRLLSRVHGPRVWRRQGRGLDLLIEAMLAQNTNLANSARGYRQLRRTFPSWTKVMTAPVEDVQRQIAVCGLARMRARRLQALLQRIKAERGALNIEFLANETPDAAVAYLLRFHGIGPKTAAYTLMLSFGMPVFPVDNGIARLAKRLRLVRQKARDAETSRVLTKLTRPAHVYAMHVLSFQHARTICRPRNPKCGECLLLSDCPYGQRRVKHKPGEQKEAIIVRAANLAVEVRVGRAREAGDRGGVATDGAQMKKPGHRWGADKVSRASLLCSLHRCESVPHRWLTLPICEHLCHICG